MSGNCWHVLNIPLLWELQVGDGKVQLATQLLPWRLGRSPWLHFWAKLFSLGKGQNLTPEWVTFSVFFYKLCGRCWRHCSRRWTPLGIQNEAFLLTPEASEKYLPHFLASNPGSGPTCCRSDAENTAALSASWREMCQKKKSICKCRVIGDNSKVIQTPFHICFLIKWEMQVEQAQAEALPVLTPWTSSASHPSWLHEQSHFDPGKLFF